MLWLLLLPFSSVISTYHHIYIFKDKGSEKELQISLEKEISSENDTLFDVLERLGINKDDLNFRSTGKIFFPVNFDKIP